MSLAVIDHDSVGVQLGDAAGRTRVEGRRFTLRHLTDLAEQFGRRGLVDLGLLLEASSPNGVKQKEHPKAFHVRSLLGGLQRDPNVTLRAEIVHLVALVKEQLRQVRAVPASGRPDVACELGDRTSGPPWWREANTEDLHEIFVFVKRNAAYGCFDQPLITIPLFSLFACASVTTFSSD